jgi:hypothetical protein
MWLARILARFIPSFAKHVPDVCPAATILPSLHGLKPSSVELDIIGNDAYVHRSVARSTATRGQGAAGAIGRTRADHLAVVSLQAGNPLLQRAIEAATGQSALAKPERPAPKAGEMLRALVSRRQKSW